MAFLHIDAAMVDRGYRSFYAANFIFAGRVYCLPSGIYRGQHASRPIDLNGVSGWLAQGAFPDTANLVLYFGTRCALENGQRYGELRDMFPGAHVVGCSTGGQIAKSDIISDDDIAAVALSFDRTRLKLATAPATNSASSRTCGETIGKALAAPDLAGIFILSDGLNVNGSALVAVSPRSSREGTGDRRIGR